MSKSDEEKLAEANARLMEVGLRLLKEGEPPSLRGRMSDLLREHEKRTYEKRIKPRDLKGE